MGAGHVLDENGEGSEAVTEFVREQVEGYGRTLKVCTGLTPLGDDNLDIDPMLPGVTLQGDMLDLPVRSFRYGSTVTDPPWLELSIEERERAFSELVRVTALDGRLIQNSPWYSTDPDGAHLIDVRVRQEDDVWGNPSFIAIYSRHARDYDELAAYYGYDPRDRHTPDDPDARDAYLGSPRVAAEMEPEENTDPRAVDPTYSAYACPLCGCSSLSGGPGISDEADCHVCAECEYPAKTSELDALASAVVEAADTDPQDGRIMPADVGHVDHTPEVVDRRLSAYERGDRDEPGVDPTLPWVPTRRLQRATDEHQDDPTAATGADSAFGRMLDGPGVQTTLDADVWHQSECSQSAYPNSAGTQSLA